jgi:hypothetical protein
MERKGVERRTLLIAGAAAASMLGPGASSSMAAGTGRASADTAQTPIQDQIVTAIQRFRETIPANFDRDFVENAVVPLFLTSLFEGERPVLPMIDVNFSKQNALPFEILG